MALPVRISVRSGFRKRGDLRLGRSRFRDQQPQGLGRVLQKACADRPLPIDEAADGSLVDAQPPRGRGNATKHLDTMGKVILRVLRRE